MTEELQDVDLWEILWGCSSRKELLRLFKALQSNFNELEKLCNGDVPSIMRLRTFVARAMAIGMIRGLQHGTQLGVRSSGTIAESMLKYPSVTRLLLREKPKASTLEVCRALEVANEPLPWPQLRKKNRLWTAWSKNSTVKMAISHARKDAVQTSFDEKFIALLKGIGDEGTVFDRFQVKKRALAKRRT